MLCNICNIKEATVFLTQIIDGKMQKMNLCEACAKEKGVDDPSGFALAEMLLGLGTPQDRKKEPLEITCPVCHFSQSDFKKTGRLGCSTCYDIFLEGLLPMLRTMHSGMVHRGKVPVKLSLERAQKFQLKALQETLETAIAQEQYETAARLRDEIQELQKHCEERVKQSSLEEVAEVLSLENVVKGKKGTSKKKGTSLTTRSYRKGEKELSSDDSIKPLSNPPADPNTKV